MQKQPSDLLSSTHIKRQPQESSKSSVHCKKQPHESSLSSAHIEKQLIDSFSALNKNQPQESSSAHCTKQPWESSLSSALNKKQPQELFSSSALIGKQLIDSSSALNKNQPRESSSFSSLIEKELMKTSLPVHVKNQPNISCSSVHVHKGTVVDSYGSGEAISCSAPMIQSQADSNHDTIVTCCKQDLAVKSRSTYSSLTGKQASTSLVVQASCFSNGRNEDFRSRRNGAINDTGSGFRQDLLPQFNSGILSNGEREHVRSSSIIQCCDSGTSGKHHQAVERRNVKNSAGETVNRHVFYGRRHDGDHAICTAPFSGSSGTYHSSSQPLSTKNDCQRLPTGSQSYVNNCCVESRQKRHSGHCRDVS